MIKPKFVFCAAAFFLICFFNASNLTAQTPPNTIKRQAETSYEIVFQVLIGSNASSEKSAAPPALASVVRKLKTNYAFSNYRVASTYIQRIADFGNATFNGVSNEPAQNAAAPVFSKWSIDQFQVLPDASGRDSISIRNFSFGQRIPVRMGALDDGDKTGGVVSYEQIGLTLGKLVVPVGEPTVIGNLSAAKPDELMFLILTVKRAE